MKERFSWFKKPDKEEEKPKRETLEQRIESGPEGAEGKNLNEDRQLSNEIENSQVSDDTDQDAGDDDQDNDEEKKD